MFAVGGVLALASIASACNIPVFRYALERWRSDAYEIVVPADEALDANQKAFVEKLEAASNLRGGKANLNVIRNSAVTDADQAVIVRGTGGGRIVGHWRGTIDEASEVGLLESPVRKELVRRLLAGDSVVWLVLQSSDAATSRAAAELLTTAFKTLDTKIKLPDGIGLPGSELHSEVPLFVKFSFIEIKHDDPAEQFLIQSLSNQRADDAKSGEPLLVPVFGRGRALEVIPAKDLSAQLVEDLTMFLSGACSCQVKEQNPGFDLLLNVNWDTELYGEDGMRPPPPKSVGDAEKPAVLLTIPPGKKR